MFPGALSYTPPFVRVLYRPLIFILRDRLPGSTRPLQPNEVVATATLSDPFFGFAASVLIFVSVSSPRGSLSISSMLTSEQMEFPLVHLVTPVLTPALVEFPGLFRGLQAGALHFLLP